MNSITPSLLKTELFDIFLPKNKCLVFDIKERDPIKDRPFTELIQEQAEMNLPYILAVTHESNATQFFDAFNLREWCYEKSLSEPDLKLCKIFFFTISVTGSQSDSFKYLGHSKETGNRGDFLATFFEALEGKKLLKESKIDPQDLIQRLKTVEKKQFFDEAINNDNKYYDENWSSEKKIKIQKLIIEACEGNPEAQFAIGKYHLKTENPDGKLTIKWWKLAAAGQNIEAQFQLSVCYEKGICVSKNSEKAFILSSSSKRRPY